MSRSFHQQLKAQQQHVEEGERQRREEAAWLTQQLAKVKAIQSVVEERRRETERLQAALRHCLASARPAQQPQQTAAVAAPTSSPSLLSSLFSHKDSQPAQAPQQSGPSSSPSLSSSQSLLSWEPLLQRTRKSIKETQAVLEQQNLIVDSIDMNEHPATFRPPAAADAASASAPSSAASSLGSIKAVRKDTVTYIQTQLQHVDALERHVQAFEAFLLFLQHNAGHQADNAAQPLAPSAAAAGKDRRPATAAAGHSDGRQAATARKARNGR